MDLQSTFIKRIVYKKTALKELSAYLKFIYYEKNVLIVTTKSMVGKYLTELINALSLSKCTFKTFIAKNNFCKDEIFEVEQLLSKEQFNLIISFGAGKCCEVTKYFASSLLLPFIVCPTAPTSLAYFTDYCINPYDETKSFYGKLPNKIFISEELIRRSSDESVKKGINFLSAFMTIVADIKIYNTFTKDDRVDINLNLIDKKITAEIENIITGGEEERLMLMDIFIELGFILNESKFNLNNTILYSYIQVLQKTLKKSDMNLNFDELFIICSDIIINTYCSFLSLNSIKTLETPNYLKISKFIAQNNITIENLNGFLNYKNLMKSNKDIKFLNYIKNNLLNEINSIKNTLKNRINIIRTINDKNLKHISIEKCFNSFGIIPFAYKSNYLLNYIGASGYLNALL